MSTLPVNDVNMLFFAMRYAIDRRTAAGSIVIDQLTEVIDRVPYADRKQLETEIADALFKDTVDPLMRAQWEDLITTIQSVP